MPFVAASIDLPPETVAIRAGDADGDGEAELIAVSQRSAGAEPDRVSLSILQIRGGRSAGQSRIELGNRAQLWEVAGGLFGVDGAGLWALDAAGGAPRQLAELVTPLAGIGPATPQYAPLARDLDGDGEAELLVFAGGQLCAFGTGGQPLGCVPAPPRGGLETGGEGGLALSVSTGSRRVHFGDVDGDGLEDLLIPEGDRVQVWYTGEAIGVRGAVLDLPLNLEPRDRGGLARGEVEREITDRWFRDFDGDGVVDLALVRAVMEGSWFGATSELIFCRGTGSGFAPPSSVSFESAAAEPEPLDIDGDGDLDLLVPQVDVSLGNIAQALMSRSVSVRLKALELRDGHFAAEPEFLREVDFPIDPAESFLVQYRLDFTGDGRPDLLFGDPDGELLLYPGTAEGLDRTPLARIALPIPPEAELLVADLDGDGRAEAFLWGRRADRGVLLTLR